MAGQPPGEAGGPMPGLPPPIHPAWGGRPARPFCPENWKPRFARLVYHLADVHDELYLRLVEQPVDQLAQRHAELHGHVVVIDEHDQLVAHLHQEHA